MILRKIIGTRWVGRSTITESSYGTKRTIKGVQFLHWLLECDHTHAIMTGDRKGGKQVAKRKECYKCEELFTKGETNGKA